MQKNAGVFKTKKDTIMYKKVAVPTTVPVEMFEDDFAMGIAKLYIPKDTVCVRPMDRKGRPSTKIRCEKASVTEIDLLNCGIDADYDHYCVLTNRKPNEICRSIYNKNFKYEIDHEVHASYLDLDIYNECGGGIHMFETKEDAMNYMFFCQ